MKTVIRKLAKAKECIKNTKIEKKGENTFSKYKYFTPDQVEQLVYDACKDNSLVTTFELVRNEFGEHGKLTVWETTSGDKIDFTMATAIPSIKATNIAQQLGGCVTYTERYLKMSTFGIADNSLDFDSQDNTKQPKKEEPKKAEPTVENFKALLSLCDTLPKLQECWSKVPKKFMAELTPVKDALKKKLSK